MKITSSFKFGWLSKGGYRHYPILYLAHGKDGFSLSVFGLYIIVKLSSK